MGVDIFFIVMAAFGFYFGFTFGLMKVGLMVLSLCFGILMAMAFTPTTTRLMAETFQIESDVLPFIAFVLTLLIVMMLARILTKLFEENVDNKKFNTISQVVGGLVMAFFFTFLYSVLVVFFGKARVIDLVFNDDIIITSQNQNVRLAIQKSLLKDDDGTIKVKLSQKQVLYKKLQGAISFGIETKYETVRANPLKIDTIHKAFTGNEQVGKYYIPAKDTMKFRGNQEMYITSDGELICFCDSTFLVEASNDTIFFQCLDESLASKYPKSFFYAYIEVIPKRATNLAQHLLPFVGKFIEDMSISLEHLTDGKKTKNMVIDVTSEDENKTTNQPVDENSDETKQDSTITVEPDSIQFSIDTSIIPDITPTTDSTQTEETFDDEEDEDVEYEG